MGDYVIAGFDYSEARNVKLMDKRLIELSDHEALVLAYREIVRLNERVTQLESKV